MKGRVSIKGTMNGFPFRSSLFPTGDGTHHLAVNKTMLADFWTRPGDTVKLAFSIDSKAHIVAVPKAFLPVFRSRKAKAFFDTLSPSHKREYIGYAVEAKKEQRENRESSSVLRAWKGKRNSGEREARTIQTAVKKQGSQFLDRL